MAEANTKQKVEERAQQLCEPLIAAEGLELLDLEFIREHGGWILRLFIDKPGGTVGVEECALASHAVDKALDIEDFIARENHSAAERHESDEAKARGIVAAELKRLGWTGKELKQRRKGDVKKVAIARRLRAETTMTLKWIAAELQMGVWTHVSNLLSLRRRQRKVKP